MPDVTPIPPDRAYPIAYIMSEDATTHMEFLQKAFDAQIALSMPMPDGKIGHAEIEVGGGFIYIADDPGDFEYSTTPAGVGGKSTATIFFYVEDVDATFEQAVAAGATVVEGLTDQFYGDRSAQLRDPWGHVWSIATHVRDVSMEEMQEAMANYQPPEQKG